MSTVLSSLQASLAHKIDQKTKPPGSLGRLEDIAARLGMVQQTLTPVITKPHVIVFAGDHGIAATGLVNPYPQAVTAQMVLNFINGGAAINVFCRQHRLALKVVDCGVNADFEAAGSFPGFIDAKVARGTRNYLEQPAMTAQQALTAIENGKRIVGMVHDDGCNLIGLGEMGIGNTSSASLLMSVLTGIPIGECVGRGTGLNDAQLATKIETLRTVREQYAFPDPFTALQTVGGFEIAAMAGACLEAARRNMIIVVDGFITTAAVLVAKALAEQDENLPPFTEWGLVFAHTSGEQGHKKMLAFLGAEPLLNLNMRLGEGTGAALAIPLIQSAACFLNEMASFESAGISDKA